jgi:hypothetical protein
MVVKKLTSIFLASLLSSYLGITTYKNLPQLKNFTTTTINYIQSIKDNQNFLDNLSIDTNIEKIIKTAPNLELLVQDNIEDGYYVNISSVKNLSNLNKQREIVNNIDIETRIHFDNSFYKHLSGPFYSIEDAKENANKLLSHIGIIDTLNEPELGVVNVKNDNYSWIEIVRNKQPYNFSSDFDYMIKKLDKKGYPLHKTLKIIKSNVDKYNTEVRRGQRTTPNIGFNLASAIAYIESTYDPSAVAHGIKSGKRVKLGQGLFQITLDTAIDIIKNDLIIQSEFYKNGLISDMFKDNMRIYIRHGNNGNGRTALNKMKAEFEKYLINADISSRLGISYIGFLLERFDNDLIKMAAAYNAGPGALNLNNRGIPHWQDEKNRRYQETRNYTIKFMSALETLPKYH